MSRLALGGAQFGLDYGITNRAGQVDQQEVAAILALAAESGVDTIDTARLYGDSEQILGCQLPAGSCFRIVSKTVKFSGLSADQAVQQLHAAFAASLQALRRPSVYALLIHDPRDLAGPTGPKLWSALEQLKAADRVEKIGVSVYEPEEADRLLERFPLDLIQVPFNALDQRLVEGGQLQRLASAGVEVHARSLFLQGLLLSPLDQIPPNFAPVRSALAVLDAEFARHGLTRLEGLLAIGLSRNEIARFVVGVTTAIELRAIILAAARVGTMKDLQIASCARIDTLFLNPARWPELT